MNATNAERQVFVLNRAKTGISDHSLERLLIWKSSNTLDKILISFPLTSQDVSHWRYDCE